MSRNTELTRDLNHRVLVVHLARLADGRQAFQRFVESYRQHPAGVQHDLLIVFKGFSTDSSALPLWKDDLAGLDYSDFYMDDVDFDIGAYCRVAEQYPMRPIFVLNSNSFLRVDNWLELIVRHAHDHVLIGATGSWENPLLVHSLPTSCIRVISQSEPTDTPSSVTPKPRWFSSVVSKMIRSFIRSFILLALRKVRWQNPHLRTNALLFPPGFFKAIHLPRRLPDKQHAHACESGHRSISRQARKLGFTLLVVDCKGITYPWREWPKSHTFRMGEQDGLIVEDKQTLNYAQATGTERAKLSKLAWGVIQV